MTREAFDISERFHIPVMIRLVTRLAHSRGIVHGARGARREPAAQGPARGGVDPAARRTRAASGAPCSIASDDIRALRGGVAVQHRRGRARTATSASSRRGSRATTILENLDDLPSRPAAPAHRRVSVPGRRRCASSSRRLTRVLVLEEGYPLRRARAARHRAAGRSTIQGRESGRRAARRRAESRHRARRARASGADAAWRSPGLSLPNRPPQLCAGCPHGDSFHSITSALSAFPDAIVTSDIGCYTLGALPPYNAIETCVCMGASVGMAKGAADAGYHPVVAVIGDSTFLHSGVTPLMDAVAADTPMTLIILDNKTVAMTGGQPTHPALVRARRPWCAASASARLTCTSSRRTRGGRPRTRRSCAARSTTAACRSSSRVRECIETAKRSKQEKTGGRGRGGVTTMKFDIILAGVGGQGVLSVSADHRVERHAGRACAVKQSEVHGMSQRGGAVLANLRLSDQPDCERPHPARDRRP